MAVVIATGAGHGIGFYTAKALLDSGWQVAGIDIVIDQLVALESGSEGRLLAVCADVTDEAQITAAVSAVMDRWGHIDVLLNNAALALFRSFDEKDITEMQRELDVNLLGYARMIKAVLPVMKAQGGGRILNVGSGVGITGYPGLSGYSSSKGGIEAFTRTLALELKPHNIAVVLVHPPLTNTASAAPMGLPPQVMADPAVVGRKLARQLMSSRATITPDVGSRVGVFFMRLFPTAFGRFLSGRAARARSSRGLC
jgi:NAD(P)-dependent dehydrogenase (short-subunit alcohol dehydrogenase family)